MILWRTYDNLSKNTGLLWKLYEYGDVHVMRLMPSKSETEMQTVKNEDPDQTAHIFTGRDETELRFFAVIMKIKSNRLQGVNLML